MTSQSKLKSAAQANANYFNRPYVFFLDANQNPRVERYDPTLTCHRRGTIFQPQTATMECPKWNKTMTARMCSCGEIAVAKIGNQSYCFNCAQRLIKRLLASVDNSLIAARALSAELIKDKQ